MVDVPPPPENPFTNEQDPFANGASESETLDQGRPNVAANPGRVLAVVGIVGAVLLFLLYNIFSGGKKEEKIEEKPRQVAAPIEPPPLPAAPEITAPPPVITPPTIPAPVSIAPTINPEDDAAAKKEALARLHSGLILLDNNKGSALFGDDDKKDEKKVANGDPNSAFEAAVVANSTEAEKVEATRIADLHRTIAQGRIIQATMESALNTDMPAPIRAIVSRDTYAEAGHEVLIPKGSRLIGSYNTDIMGGQSRVFVVWTRVIRPDGVDVMLGSPLVDQIGQAGVAGQVDSKFQDIFSRSVLSSIVAISLAIGSDKINPGETTTTTTTGSGGSSSSTSGDPGAMATVDALKNLGDTTSSFLDKFLQLRPTILVDQGTPVNVFVNRDLIFPARMGHSTEIVN